jgi:hypothetical protein
MKSTLKKKLHKTRNIVLLSAVSMVVFYTALDIIFGFVGMKLENTYQIFQFDATLTQNWFDFWKWMVISGAGITIVKTAKGKTNSDDDEPPEEPQGKTGQAEDPPHVGGVV